MKTRYRFKEYPIYIQLLMALMVIGLLIGLLIRDYQREAKRTLTKGTGIMSIKKALKEIDQCKTYICNKLDLTRKELENGIRAAETSVTDIEPQQIWRRKIPDKNYPLFAIIVQIHQSTYGESFMVRFFGYYKSNNIPQRMDLPYRSFVEQYEYLPHKKLSSIDKVEVKEVDNETKD